MPQLKNTKHNKKSRKSNSPIAIILIIAVFVIAIFALAMLNKNQDDNSLSNNPSARETVKDSDLVIQLSDISDQAAFYPAEAGGIKLEVIAVKASDGSIRTAFNTCQVCYSSGRGYYEQEGDTLVCQNCGNRLDMDEVEVTRGGCNPVPITSEHKTVDETSIIVSKEFLEEASVIFANWKTN